MEANQSQPVSDDSSNKNWKDRLKAILLFIWGHRILFGLIILGLIAWQLIANWNIFSIWVTQKTAGNTPIVSGADHVDFTDPTGQKKSHYKNPSANVVFEPVTDPATGKPGIEAKIQEAGLTVVPQVTALWDFTDSQPTWLAGPQLGFFDAFGAGIGANNKMLGVVVDRRFKISKAASLAPAFAAATDYGNILRPLDRVHWMAGMTFKLGF